ncbi:glucose-1-phosphate cytidylyltransferase [Clostridia bacterium]|nr:glucose-1-phosphate cytidylyltransferase [Clostridia bacterium]
MKTVILAGGLGTRISEENNDGPKPMIKIGGQPIIWHIMKLYSSFGHNDFVICSGHKKEYIRDYFTRAIIGTEDMTFDFSGENKIIAHQKHSHIENWRVTLADTGEESQTGSRVRKIRKYIDSERFFLTYGDGVSDVDINALLKKHEDSGKTVTITAVQPGNRFGVLDITEDDTICGFREKPKDDGVWINGGFMVAELDLFDVIPDGDSCILEREPLEKLGASGKLGAYRHNGFWHCMDTPRDKAVLENLWRDGTAPWKVW